MSDIKYSCQVRPAAYTTFGQPLPVDQNGHIHWHMANWGTDMDRYHQIGLVANAFSEWQQHLFPWRFVSTANPDKADWLIFWAKDNTITMPDGTSRPSEFNFKNNPGTLAVQYASPHLVMIINDDHDYRLEQEGPSSHDLYKVLIHELCHGLGLGHTKAPGDIMQPIYDPRNKITEDSISGLHAVQGAKLRADTLRLPVAKRFVKLYVQGITERPKKRRRSCLQRLGLKK